MISWHPQAWEDYLYWQVADERILRRINALVKDVQRTPFEGLGNPEPLKYEWSGFWSRRITEEHRLVYTIQSGQIIIAQCRYHY